MSQELIRSLVSCFERENLTPVLVGGWAVQHHGYPRATIDIDLLLCSQNQVQVTSFLKSIGYNEGSTGTMVTRFVFKDPGYPMLDILWVNRETYQKILDRSEESPNNPGNKVISLEDLLAMKLHALHHHEDRDGKDLLDIRSLLRYNRGVISDDRLHELCEDYGPSGAYELIKFTAS